MSNLTYLVSERLYQHISGSDLPLTALVPAAISHCHPIFVDTVRQLAPSAEVFLERRKKLINQFKFILSDKLDFIQYLETANALVYEASEDKLTIGSSEVVSKNASIYHAFWVVYHVINLPYTAAIKNSFDCPQEFFKHLTNTLTPNTLKKYEADFELAADELEAFIRSRAPADSLN